MRLIKRNWRDCIRSRLLAPLAWLLAKQQRRPGGIDGVAPGDVSLCLALPEALHADAR